MSSELIGSDSDANDNKGDSRLVSQGLFEAFYQHFILRDLFGKVIPGFIVLTSTGAVLLDKNELKDFVLQSSALCWIAAIGAGWLAGFVVQSVGESIGLILYYPKDTWSYRWFRLSGFRSWEETLKELKGTKSLHDAKRLLDEAEFRTHQEFYQFSSPIKVQYRPDEARNIERLTVIKEACGNGYVALLIASCLLTIRYFVEHEQPARLGLGIVALLFALLALARMHFEHVKRQHLLSVQCIRRNIWKQRLGTEG